MRVRVVQQSKRRGDLVIAPRFVGKGKGSIAGVGVRGVVVGKELGETTVVQSGGTQVVLISMGEAKDVDADVFRRVGGSAAKWLIRREVKRVGVDTAAVVERGGVQALGSLAEGLVLGAFQFDRHKSDSKRPARPAVDLLVSRASKAATEAVARASTLGEAVNYARAVAHEPPNVINPVSLAALARGLARDTTLKCTVHDETQMKRMKMGAILAVGQGSDSPPRMIVLEHKGRAAKAKPIVLLGKAITFDTGGYSIKPRDGIVGMKYDKCGAMAVLGVMKAVADLKIRTPVVGILAAAENMVSGGAYRPDDIITTMSGKTVEIVSADAEGRLVLSDALTYAQRRYTPRAVVDVATLTGGVVIALGKVRAGLFANDDGLRDAIMASADRTAERLWPLPTDDDYLEALKGSDSDLKNSAGREGHAILGAMFLKQFVESETKWAHLDIAGVASTDKDLPYCPKGATGFGVRLLVDYIDHVRS